VWFSVVAVFLYLIPRFQSVRYAPAFLVLVLLSLLIPQTLWAVFLLSLSFFILLGIKEMVFVRRMIAYQCLSYIALFLALLIFFFHFGAWGGDQVSSHFVFILALLPALCYGVLLYGVVRELKNRQGSAEGLSSAPRALSRDTETNLKKSLMPDSYVTLLSAFIFWQLTLAALFLPLDFLRQTGVAFLAGVVFIEIIPSYIAKSLNVRSVLILALVFLALLFFILVSASWRY
jgi:hypothetical protein